MKKGLLLLLVVGSIFYILFASGDARAVFNWVLMTYLVMRAAPRVWSDFRWLTGRVKLGGLRGFRRSKVDTL